MIRVIGQGVRPARRSLSERSRTRCRWARVLVVLGLLLPWCRGDRLQGADWVAPVALALSRDGQTLHVAGARGRQVLTLDLPTAQVVRAMPLDEAPTGLALSAHGKELAVTCAGQTNAVLLLDPTTGEVKRRLPAGAGVCSPVFNRAGTTLYVCLRFENAVAAIDLGTGRERARLPTRREPIAAALTPDERLLVVANHLPDGPANTRFVATAVTVVDTALFTVRTNLMLPNGSVALRGVAIAPSGKLAAVTHNVARFQVPTTQVEHGWMNDSALSLIDLETLTLKNTKSLLWSHRTPPAMSHGVRGTAEKAVRSGLRNILFALRPETEAVAIDEYLKALRPVPSPDLVGGDLSEAARRGQRLFEDPKVGCASCHPAPLFTDQKSYTVGTQNRTDRRGDRFDTPTLVECWRTAPYLHDGSAAALQEVLTTRNPEDEHGHTSHLTPADIQDLTAYVRSL
jgi:mono/diheme cytochrome c family protein